MLTLIVLEIESLFHNKRITDTIFNELIYSANRMHANSYYSNKIINETIYKFDNDKLKINDLENKNLIKNLNANSVDNYFNLTIIQRKNALLYEFCKSCNDDSLEIITIYNS